MQRKKIIVDTDIGCDCDDSGALAALHALAARGEAEILAVTHVTSSPSGPGTIEVINRFYQKPEIPIGALPEKDFMGAPRYDIYASKTVERFGTPIKDRWHLPSAENVIRKALVGQPDHSVTIVCIGQLRNMKRLLQTGPDDISPLDGAALAAEKVGELVVMGGYFPKPGQVVYLDGKKMEAEFNIINDIDSARFVAENWPTPIMYSGFEIGSRIRTGSLLKYTREDNPVRFIFETYCGENGVRESWDQTAVLYAVRGLRDYWDESSAGTVEIDEKGVTRLQTGTDRRQRYLLEKRPPDTMAGLIDKLMAYEIQNKEEQEEEYER